MLSMSPNNPIWYKYFIQITYTLFLCLEFDLSVYPIPYYQLTPPNSKINYSVIIKHTWEQLILLSTYTFWAFLFQGSDFSDIHWFFDRPFLSGASKLKPNNTEKIRQRCVMKHFNEGLNFRLQFFSWNQWCIVRHLSEFQIPPHALCLRTIQGNLLIRPLSLYPTIIR